MLLTALTEMFGIRGEMGDSPVRMDMAELPEYVGTLLELRKEYEKDILIKIGFEAEYIPKLFEELMDIMKEYPIDYFILGQHFLEEENNYMGRSVLSAERLGKYVNTVLEGLATGRFSYLAHPDLINFVGNRNVYEKEMERLCVACKRMDIPLEINGLGLYEGRNYPFERFFRIAAKVGNRVIIGYDAHESKALLDEATYQNCVSFAKRLNSVPEESYRI